MTAESFSRNFDHIMTRLIPAAEKAGRNPQQVRIMAVTKTFPVECVRLAAACGITLFGENRVQEAVTKYKDLQSDVELHLIGHLQRNKAKQAVGFFKCIQSVDKLSTAQAVQNHAAATGLTLDVLLQVNTSGESTKFGTVAEAEFTNLLTGILNMPNLCLKGLMTLGPFTSDPIRSHQAFAALRDLLEKTKAAYALPDFEVLSMGMSSDFEAAVAEGANLVRLGTALFGRR